MTVVFQTDQRHGLNEIFKEISNAKNTLSTLYQLYDTESLFLFSDGTRLDVSFLKPSTFATWKISDDKSKILYDPKGVIIAQIEKSKEIEEKADKPGWNKNEGSYIDWYFWMFRQAYCYALQSRGRGVPSFDKLYSAHTTIHSIRKALLDVIYYMNGKKDYLNNIDPSLAAALSDTFSNFTAAGVLQSVRILVNLYEQIFPKYCTREKIEYPKIKIEQIKKLFDEFDAAAKKIDS